MRFLLIEDNVQLAKAICDHLQSDGHVADHAECLAVADDFLATTSYEMILLDIMLPDGDGRDFLNRYRAHAGKSPVIVLTARSEVSDRVGVLDLGADDYMTKPFDFSELDARCRAVLRRQGGAATNRKHFGGVEFDGLAGTLMHNGVTTHLRNKELRLLETFFNTPDQIYSKAKLVDRLFSYEEDVSENAIEVYVARVRKHLEGSGIGIVTVRGVGYRLSLT